MQLLFARLAYEPVKSGSKIKQINLQIVIKSAQG